MKTLKWILIVLASLIVLVVLFYAEEDWRGKRAWEKFKHEWEAKGERFDLVSLVPPPVPDEQNFAMTPIPAVAIGGLLPRRPRRTRNGIESNRLFL